MKVNPEIVVKLAADSFEKLNAYPAEPLSVMFVDPAPAPVMVKPLPDVVIPVVTVKDPAATLIVDAGLISGRVPGGTRPHTGRVRLLISTKTAADNETRHE